MKGTEYCERHNDTFDVDDGCEYCYKEWQDRQELIAEFIERWNILLKWCNDIGFDYEIYKGNIKNFIIKEIEKWEGELKK